MSIQGGGFSVPDAKNSVVAPDPRIYGSNHLHYGQPRQAYPPQAQAAPMYNQVCPPYMPWPSSVGCPQPQPLYGYQSYPGPWPPYFPSPASQSWSVDTAGTSHQSGLVRPNPYAADCGVVNSKRHDAAKLGMTPPQQQQAPPLAKPPPTPADKDTRSKSEDETRTSAQEGFTTMYSKQHKSSHAYSGQAPRNAHPTTTTTSGMASSQHCMSRLQSNSLTLPSGNRTASSRDDFLRRVLKGEDVSLSEPTRTMDQCDSQAQATTDLAEQAQVGTGSAWLANDRSKKGDSNHKSLFKPVMTATSPFQAVSSQAGAASAIPRESILGKRPAEPVEQTRQLLGDRSFHLIRSVMLKQQEFFDEQVGQLHAACKKQRLLWAEMQNQLHQVTMGWRRAADAEGRWHSDQQNQLQAYSHCISEDIQLMLQLPSRLRGSHKARTPCKPSINLVRLRAPRESAKEGIYRPKPRQFASQDDCQPSGQPSQGAPQLQSQPSPSETVGMPEKPAAAPAVSHCPKDSTAVPAEVVDLSGGNSALPDPGQGFQSTFQINSQVPSMMNVQVPLTANSSFDLHATWYAKHFNAKTSEGTYSAHMEGFNFPSSMPSGTVTVGTGCPSNTAAGTASAAPSHWWKDPTTTFGNIALPDAYANTAPASGSKQTTTNSMQKSHNTQSKHSRGNEASAGTGSTKDTRRLREACMRPPKKRAKFVQHAKSSTDGGSSKPRLASSPQEPAVGETFQHEQGAFKDFKRGLPAKQRNKRGHKDGVTSAESIGSDNSSCSREQRNQAAGRAGGNAKQPAAHGSAFQGPSSASQPASQQPSKMTGHSTAQSAAAAAVLLSFSSSYNAT